ncbi:peptide ABC transporter substrate-binding protein [Rubrimonas cliftonensis]|uniref:Peptide/nickel transport system substrate-binding protein n=1 Tax=Rubrimonas cliftonensis TaxID=89524 RepID=A0A1H3XPU3_9RHOB|nr:peptide ABC transporter substrate-binding protein [Rubrimonas cliftonensis]SEA01547.1 peptide/nickel transport system substrate-binding protein [Rubrimonas cliftonensis]
MRLKTLLMAGAALTLVAPAAMAERGADGQLNIIYWQAPSTMNPFLSGGTKEVEASSMVIEPLARFSDTGEIVPILAESIPTTDNGGVSADLRTITWKLKPGLLWSDGTPVTAADGVFTYEYCTHPEGGCAQSSYFEGIASMEAVDDLTLKITFTEPKPFPYTALVGSESPIIQKSQFENCIGARAPECTEQNFNPIGTGPFRVTEFRANDVISLEANPNYRDPAKPAFASVLFKGGGDAESAARSVLQTGEFDYAWNLQISPEVLTEMEAAGRGKVVVAFATSVERIHVNFTNPDPALGPDERSVWKEDGSNAHPILSDIRVRKALSMAIDPVILTEIGYGPTGRPTCNVLPGPEIYASTANDACLVQDIEGAKALLDEAGWIDSDGDGVREKDGKELSLLYQTSTNAVRQQFQSLIKQWWGEIGVETELRNISASVFFGGDPASPDTFQKFYADVEMYTNNFSGVDPEAYMANWICNKAPRPSTQWQGENITRWCNPEYDALAAEFSKTAGLEARADIAKRMNDMLMQDYAMIPLVHRGGTSAHANTLAGVKINDWDSELWNIADWHRVK